MSALLRAEKGCSGLFSIPGQVNVFISTRTSACVLLLARLWLITAFIPHHGLLEVAAPARIPELRPRGRSPGCSGTPGQHHLTLFKRIFLPSVKNFLFFRASLLIHWLTDFNTPNLFNTFGEHCPNYFLGKGRVLEGILFVCFLVLIFQDRISPCVALTALEFIL